MGARFYPGRSALLSWLLAGALAGCGGTAAPPAPADGESPWFPPPREFVPSYQPPAGGDLLPRFLGHLDRATKEGLRFALERIGESGAAAVPELVAAIEQRIQDPNRFASLHNFVQALGACGGADDAAVLLRVLRESAVPLARTAAVEALAQIGAVQLVPELIRAVEIESEIGPRLALYRAIGQLGGPEGAAFLEREAAAWLQGVPSSNGGGDLAWSHLLALDDAGAAARLARLHPVLRGLPLQAAALRRRAELGEAGVAPELRRLLDPATAPAASVRAAAVEGLAFAGDWEGVLLGLDDPQELVRAAVVNALSLPAARALDAGHAWLEELAQAPPSPLAQAAMHALCLRGDRRLLETWLVRAQGFPQGQGSVAAIDLLKHEDAADPRTVPVLLGRWEACDTDQRLGLLRVFGRLADPRTQPLFEDLVLGARATAPELRQMALTQLANCGELGEDLLLRYLGRPVPAQDAAFALGSLASLARSREASRARLVEIALDPEQADWMRAQAFPLLVKALGGAAYAPLLQARDEARRSEVRAALDRLLAEFF